MNAEKKLSELKKRQNEIVQGNADLIAKQQKDGKLTARDRLANLFDEGTFIEIGAFVNQRPTEFGAAVDAKAEGVVTGYGAVDGRLTYAYAQDVTVLGGAISEMHSAKIVKIIDMAIKMGAPVVSLLESNGARLLEGVDSLAGYGKIAAVMAKASGVIPQIAVVCGLCSGGNALVAATADFVVMTKKAELFLNAPIVIKNAIGDKADDIGTAKASAENGNAHFVVEDDSAAIACAKELLFFLPSNNLEISPVVETSDDINRFNDELNNVVTDENTNIRTIITTIVDDGAFCEVQSEFAKTIITGFARMGGESVAIIANNGELCYNCSTKAARFINLCDSFNIPVITLTDVDGYKITACQEKKGNIRAIARLMGAYASATCPKINVIVKNAFGSAYAVMGTDSDVTFAYPTATIGVMKPDAAVTILMSDKLKGEKDPAAKRAELEAEYKDVLCAPYEAAKRGYVDDVIEPASTRVRVMASLMMLQSKRVTNPSKKHTNMPL